MRGQIESEYQTINGHVVMVDKVGVDPFGIALAKTFAACSSLRTNNFDFTIIQSIPEKGSLEINRFIAKDYLAGGGTMATMFLGYAKAACLSRFDKVARNLVTPAYGIIRHQQTDSCLADRIALVNESCVQQCASYKAQLKRFAICVARA